MACSLPLGFKLPKYGVDIVTALNHRKVMEKYINTTDSETKLCFGTPTQSNATEPRALLSKN